MAVPGQLINTLRRSAGDVFAAAFPMDGGNETIEITVANQSGRRVTIVVPANSSANLAVQVTDNFELPVGIPSEAIQLPARPPPMGKTERRLLEHIDSTPRPAKAIALAAGYKYTSHIRRTLSKLASAGRICRTHNGLSRS